MEYCKLLDDSNIIHWSQDSIDYILNKKDKTAIITRCNSDSETIQISSSIIYESEEYFITTISSDSFKYLNLTDQITFSSDSRLQKIEKNAFNSVNLKIFTIPSSLVEIEDEWCISAPYINEIYVNDGNPFFQVYDDKFLLKKSSSEKEVFDILIFCVRDIEIAKIPSFVEVISPYAFENCEKLKRVEFESGSNLRKIGNNAFKKSSIEYIQIPPHVTSIEEATFLSCKKLECVEFTENSELYSISRLAFCTSSIKKLILPKSIVKFDERWCMSTPNLNQIKILPGCSFYTFYDDKYLLGKTNPENEKFDVLLFCRRDLKSIEIPHSVDIIREFAFCQCSMEKISIPPWVKQFDEHVFFGCQNLNQIEIPEN